MGVVLVPVVEVGGNDEETVEDPIPGVVGILPGVVLCVAPMSANSVTFLKGCKIIPEP